MASGFPSLAMGSQNVLVPNLEAPSFDPNRFHHGGGSSYTRNLDRKYMFLGVWNDCQQQHDQDVFFSHVAAGDHRALGRDGRDGRDG